MTGEEINHVSEHDFKIAVAHEVLEAHSGDYTGLQTVRAANGVDGEGRFRGLHLIRCRECLGRVGEEGGKGALGSSVEVFARGVRSWKG